jgi:arginase family enzyme
MAKLKRGGRTVIHATVQALARYAGIELSEDREVEQLGLLESHVEFLNMVDKELKLGFQIDDDFLMVAPAYGLRNPPPKG